MGEANPHGRAVSQRAVDRQRTRQPVVTILFQLNVVVNSPEFRRRFALGPESRNCLDLLGPIARRSADCLYP
jgi:hypothetical protein